MLVLIWFMLMLLRKIEFSVRKLLRNNWWVL